MARIVVCGYMVRFPFAGMMLWYFQYVAGLAKLGHDVTYLEESGWENACYDPARHLFSNDARTGLASLDSIKRRFGLDQIRWAYLDRFGGHTYGPAAGQIDAIIREADLVLNLGGVCWFDAFEEAQCLALVDGDPFFTQLGRFGGARLSRYHKLFTYGVNIGKAKCTIPTLGLDWIPTLPAVVTEYWDTVKDGTPVGPPPEGAPLTTVGNWKSYGTITHDGETYGQKDVEFYRVVDLPRRVSVPLELAADNMPEADRGWFVDHGWHVTSASGISSSVESYIGHIQQSLGEFSVAKNAYVKSRSGWVSDRTICYLAAGRPAIVQETGVSEVIPTGEGLVTFTTADEAANAIQRVQGNYSAHADAARQVVFENFDYRVVLPLLLDRAFSATK